MKSSRGRRLGFALPVVLLLMTLAPAAQAASLAPEWSGQAVATIGTNSCQGTSACTGLQGDVGNNSCNGSFACYGQTGNVGNDSCVGAASACQFHMGNVGNSSCIGNGACQSSSAISATFNVGNFSCNGIAVCLDHTGDVGDCQVNTITPAPCVQPDVRIRRSGGELWGNNVYNDTGADQYVSMKIYAGDFRRVYITIQNDGLLAQSFMVCQCPYIGAFPEFPVRYFVGRSDHEITVAIEEATFNTPTLEPGETFVIRARVAITHDAFPGLVDRRIKAFSNIDPSKVDTVRIWEQRK